MNGPEQSLNREDIERREQATLAEYAALSSRSRGRAFPIKEHPLRTAFQRDRDRIIHSAAFRRMEYKTQVFIPHEKDHFRTRLTHTIEVAQISRTLARILRLNEDLAEAIALVHDLGHTPFGHSGEDVLDKLLRERGGFNHNRQSLRVVDLLEQKYPEHPGLNLSYEVREGIVKHETKVKIVLPEFDNSERPTLEAQLVDIADEIAYNGHDIDDGLESELLSLDDFRRLKLWEKVGANLADRPADHYTRYRLVRALLNYTVTDVARETQRQLKENNIQSFADLIHAKERLCGYSEEAKALVTELKGFLNERLYRHPRLTAMAEWAEEIIETIYAKLLKFPERMPKRYQEMLLTEDKEIVIADYIAGMTDRYAEKVYEEMQ